MPNNAIRSETNCGANPLKQIRINVRSKSAGKIRKEKRDGRDVIIVPSATLPDNIVMNGVRYPAEEIAKSFKTLEQSPAPYGHPKVNGKYISARSPQGINIGYIGAWNENVRQVDGRVLLDKVIDVEVANTTERGRSVLAALEKQEAIHTSTGLVCMLDTTNADADAPKGCAKNINFDHDAILLNEEGAATPDQGVGIFVNSNGDAEEIEVINSVVPDHLMTELDYAGQRLVSVARQIQDASAWQKMKDGILKMILGVEAPERKANEKEDDEMSEPKLADLSAKVDALADKINGIDAAVAGKITEAVNAALKPVIDLANSQAAKAKEQEDAEHADLVAKVVKAGVLDEVNAKATPAGVLKALLPTAPSRAAPLLANAVNGFKSLSGGDGDYKRAVPGKSAEAK